jgi:hypothetical protein
MLAEEEDETRRCVIGEGISLSRAARLAANAGVETSRSKIPRYQLYKNPVKEVTIVSRTQLISAREICGICFLTFREQ